MTFGLSGITIDIATINYPPINMGGQRYYTYVRRQVRFIVLDTNVLDATQIAWAGPRSGRPPSPGRSRTSITRCMATPAGTGRTSTFVCCWNRC